MLRKMLTGGPHGEHLCVEVVSGCALIDRRPRLRVPKRSIRYQTAEGVAIAFERDNLDPGVASLFVDAVIDSRSKASWLFETNRFEDRAWRLSFVIIVALCENCL